MEDFLAINITRQLNIESGGRASPATQGIKSLERDPIKNRWVCVWSLEHLCSRGIALGQDPIEALTNVIKLIGLFINGTEIDGINIWWKQKGDNGGFPILR